MMVEYKIINGLHMHDMEDFERVVNEHLESGWELVGGVSSIGTASKAGPIQAISRKSRVSEMDIYLVMAGHDDEGADPVKAFEDESKAEDFAKYCIDYQATKPEWPTESATEKEMNDFYEVDDLWQKAHPAGIHSDADRYYARFIEYIETFTDSPEQQDE